MIGCQWSDCPAHFGGEPAGKGRGQTHHIVTALAQRRQTQRKHIQPVKQILAELSLADGFFQIAIRCGQYPHVHLLG